MGLLRRGTLGLLTQVMHKMGSHSPSGNFSSKRGNKNFYKGRGGRKYGIPGPKGALLRMCSSSADVSSRQRCS